MAESKLSEDFSTVCAVGSVFLATILNALILAIPSVVLALVIWLLRIPDFHIPTWIKVMIWVIFTASTINLIAKRAAVLYPKCLDFWK